MRGVAEMQQMDHRKVLDFLYACGRAQSPRTFVTECIANINGLCAFDEALVYFKDGNGKVCNQYLVNIDESWSTMYLEYYAFVDDQRYSCLRQNREPAKRGVLSVRDWVNEPPQEFISSYIRPRQLKYSIGFQLFDLNGVERVIIALDRTRNVRFSGAECERLALAIPHLNNLHKNFYYNLAAQNAQKQIAWGETRLTPREVEVANLLCQGVTPANISHALCISKATAYKHISNIYAKMSVSNRQELLVRFLRQPG